MKNENMVITIPLAKNRFISISCPLEINKKEYWHIMDCFGLWLNPTRKFKNKAANAIKENQACPINETQSPDCLRNETESPDCPINETQKPLALCAGRISAMQKEHL